MSHSRPKTAALLATAAAALTLGCGYHLSGKGGSLPPHLKKIAVPQFENTTSRTELGQRITEKVVQELVSHRKYDVGPDERGADAVLKGTILSWTHRPVLLTREQSEAQRVAVTLRASVTFEDRVTGKVLWRQDGYSFTQEYDVIGDPDEYFDTELTAVEDVAKDFARAVVSAILQGF